MTHLVQQTADRLDIGEVLARYCQALDTRQWSLLGSVFAPDACCDYGSVGTPHGIDEIVAAIRGTIEDLDATQHLIGNLQVWLTGDTASASCYLISQHVRHGEPGGEHYMVGGSYKDQLVRSPDGWRISFRRLDRMWSSGNRDVVRRPS